MIGSGELLDCGGIKRYIQGVREGREKHAITTFLKHLHSELLLRAKTNYDCGSTTTTIDSNA